MGALQIHSRVRRWFIWPILVLVGGSLLSWKFALLEGDADRVQQQTGIRTELEHARGELARVLYGTLYLIEGLAALISIDGGITPERYARFAEELCSRTTLIKNLATAPDNVVRFIYPVEGNEAVLGLDYSQLPSQLPGIERMMREQTLTVSGPVELVQGGVAVIGRTPVYVRRPGAPNHYWGLVSTVLDFENLLKTTRVDQMESRFHLDLAIRGVDGLGAEGDVFWGDPAVFSKNPVIVNVILPSGSWQLAGIPDGGWPKFQVFSSVMFIAGSAISAVLAILLFGLLRAREVERAEVLQRREAEATLQELNRELKQARVSLEARVVERTRELEIARDEAQSADRLKSAFLATMSHELRTPLNSIIGFTGLLLQSLAGPLNDEQRKQLKMVSGSAKHLLALISDVLDLSKIEAAQMKLSIAPFDLRKTIETTLATISLEARQKGLSLECELADELGEMTSDKRRLEQVLLNLLGNAIKFTESGTVRIEGNPVGDRVQIRITDTGPGIPPESLKKLFQPFSQVDNGIDRKYEGTGLGLSTSKGLVELLGGRIWVESESGQGSTFAFEIPAHLPVPKSGIREE